MEANMPTSEEFDPREQQNKKGGPLPARDGREHFLIQMPAKSAGHVGVGFASMRSHSTVKSDGCNGDGSVSLRTYSTPPESAGHVGDGLAPIGTARQDVSDLELMEKPGED
eukprot:7281230-Karenia_brevis.AAC.1